MAVLHNDYEQSCFEIYENGAMAGFLKYSTGCHAISLQHTYISPEFRGRGMSPVLIGQVLDEMHRRRVLILPECPIVGGFLRSHPQYLHLIASPGSSHGNCTINHEHMPA